MLCYKKVKCDGRTDRRTNGPTKRVVESRSTRLKKKLTDLFYHFLFDSSLIHLHKNRKVLFHIPSNLYQKIDQSRISFHYFHCMLCQRWLGIGFESHIKDKSTRARAAITNIRFMNHAHPIVSDAHRIKKISSDSFGYLANA